jgi:hypothetical protein
MASEQIYLSGIAKWAKIFKPDDKYHNYSVNLALDADSQKRFDQSGLRLRPKKDEQDGITYVRFRRGEEDGPPIVVDSKGDKSTNLIGNGSKVTVRVEVYDTKTFGKGHRLMAVRVDDLIPYERVDVTADGKPAMKLPPVDAGVQF